jgi:tetratricopeptide (TPR) repeat protein
VDEAAATSLLDFAEAAVPAMKAADPADVFAEIEKRSLELNLALDWFAQRNDTDNALRLVNALYTFWNEQQRLEEGWAAFTRALVGPGGDARLRATAWINAGFLSLWSEHEERSPEAFDHGLSMSRDLGDRELEARALGGLARIALRSDVQRGRQVAHEILELSESTGDRKARSDALHLLGVAAQIVGDLVEAGTWMRERLRMLRDDGDEGSTAVEAGNLGTVERQMGNLDDAEILIREALEIADRRGDEFVKPFAISGLAAVATDRGDLVRAATLLGATEGILEVSGITWPSDEKPHYDRMLAMLPARMGATAFDAARAAGRSMNTAEAVAFALDATDATSTET